jgi:hypothetical protein
MFATLEKDAIGTDRWIAVLGESEHKMGRMDG